MSISPIYTTFVKQVGFLPQATEVDRQKSHIADIKGKQSHLVRRYPAIYKQKMSMKNNEVVRHGKV